MCFFNNYKKIIDYVYYSAPTFSTEAILFKKLINLINENKKILVYGDYDVDGAMCVKILTESFKLIHYKNYDVYKYSNRTHSIDKGVIYQCVRGNYDAIIICDTGSSSVDLDKLHQLLDLKKQVIILDHHKTNLDYSDFPANVAIINTTLENKKLGYDFFKLSAGALCYCVMDKFLQKHFSCDCINLSAFALTSLYADCMDMSNELNRSIYWRATGLSEREIPLILRRFINEYTEFGKRYIEFWFAPRINALFRTENFEILNNYLFNEDISSLSLSRIIDTIEEIYSVNRSLLDKISDIVNVEILNNFVLCNLMEIDSFVNVQSNKLYNYTGLLASKLTSRYNKTAIVYCQNGSSIKGSVRDYYNRNLLDFFKTFCDAGGHPPAFGFFVNLFELTEFKNTIYMVDDNITKGIIKIGNSKKQIVINHDVYKPDNSLITELAQYNEFTGGDLPPVFVSKKFDESIREIFRKGFSGYRYKWGDYYISSTYSLNKGCDYILKPVKKKSISFITQ